MPGAGRGCSAAPHDTHSLSETLAAAAAPRSPTALDQRGASRGTARRGSGAGRRGVYCACANTPK
jgi:hypothetical protein